MGDPKKYHIHLSDKEYKTLKSIIKKKEISSIVRRCWKNILDFDEDHGKILTYEQYYKSNSVYCAIVSNTFSGYAENGMEYLASLKWNVNSGNSRLKVGSCAEDRIIEIACSQVPEGG